MANQIPPNEPQPRFYPSPPQLHPAQGESAQTNAARSKESFKNAYQGGGDAIRHFGAAAAYGSSTLLKKGSRLMGRGAAKAQSSNHSKIAGGFTSVAKALMTGQAYLAKIAPKIGPKPR